MMCYELSGKVLVWEAPAISSGPGDIDEHTEWWLPHL